LSPEVCFGILILTAPRPRCSVYDGFVGILRLEDFKKEADDDETYQKARSLGHDFRDGFLEFFFDIKRAV
jgi:hypothetical protein